MKDVAAKAGVHHSTVSLCIKNSPRIPETTRSRVLKIARELGYRPHPYMNTLVHTRRRGRVGKSSGVLAFVLFNTPGDDWRAWMPQLKEWIDSARERAGARGFRLEEINTTWEQTTPRRLGDILYNRGITGVLLGPTHQSMETLDWPWSRFAVVALGPSLREPRVHRVRHHYFQAMLTAMDECRKLGYRRTGLVLKEEVNLKMEQRWLGAHILKQHEFQVNNPPRPLLTRDWSSATLIRWFREEKPDAIIAVNATDTALWLKRAGVRIPEDVGLVSLASNKTGTVSGVYQDGPMLGRRAVSLLIDLMEDNLYGLHPHPTLLLVNGIWNPGNTLRSQA